MCTIAETEAWVDQSALEVSQTVFANYLNVTAGLVSKCERGEKRPSGASLRLLTLVERNGLTAVA